MGRGAIQATTQLRALPIEPWAGLGVLAGWAAVSLLLAATSLNVRDA
jgi:ABC-2 type transport system permease protein